MVNFSNALSGDKDRADVRREASEKIGIITIE